MKKKWTNNLILKLVSVVLAFVIWLIVVNTSNPDVDASVTVPIEVRNADRLTDAQKTYSLNVKNVRISYKIRMQYRNRVNDSDFEAYIDLDDYSITGAVPIYVTVASDKENLIGSLSINPMVVHVDTEDIQRKRFDKENGNFEVTTNGGCADGYAIGSVETDTDYIYVEGPESEIGRISSVGIEIDVREASEDLSGEAVPVCYDANRNVINDLDQRVTFSRDTISYTVPVYKIKALSITAGTMGEPAEGYEFTEIDCSPSFINVYGPDEILDSYNTITIPDSEMNITGAEQNITVSVDIRDFVPEGLYLAEPGSEITLVARIRKQATVAETTEPEDEERETLEPSEPETTASDPDESAEDTPDDESSPASVSETETSESAAHVYESERATAADTSVRSSERIRH